MREEYTLITISAISKSISTGKRWLIGPFINKDYSYSENIKIGFESIEKGKYYDKHYHKKAEEIFFVLDGAIYILIEQQTKNEKAKKVIRVNQGSIIQIKPNTVHQIITELPNIKFERNFAINKDNIIFEAVVQIIKAPSILYDKIIVE